MKFYLNIESDSAEELKALFTALAATSAPASEAIVAAPAQSSIFPTPDPVNQAPRANVSPGTPGITRMGKDTAMELSNLVSKGLQPAARFAEHLKLMWQRNEVKYDGQDYYV